jgi:predicted DsbA family dithiol-disulfide isomerase
VRFTELLGAEAMAERRARVLDAAREFGLPLNNVDFTYNSRLAQEMAKWAETLDLGDRFRAAVYEAVYVRGLDISDSGVLLALAEASGLPADEAAQVLGTRRFRREVDMDCRLSRDLRIRVAPTFVIGRSRLVGAQTLERLRRFIEAHQAGERPCP